MAPQTQPAKPAPIELSPEAQATFDLITRNLDEVLLPDIIKEKLAKDEVVKCYWGTAPTGRPHLGYFVPLTKIADFLKAGVAVTVLLADVSILPPAWPHLFMPFPHGPHLVPPSVFRM
ncbi:hypothetical protein QFC19_008674 [Naganishia cerealis]|uniref:Uncharacterized protein n=1 Tax=Naganishia cerealis TaxID=610337 RepID=A0ACC2V1U5_9TREE|nr:hypothetical protein QFC19_008674 [Naganishia cerealis]